MPFRECFYCPNRTLHSDGKMTCHKPDGKVMGRILYEESEIRTVPGKRVHAAKLWGYPEMYLPQDKLNHCRNYGGRELEPVEEEVLV